MKFLVQFRFLYLLLVVTCTESIRNVESNLKNVHRTHMFSKLHKSDIILSANEEMLQHNRKSIHSINSNSNKPGSTVHVNNNNIFKWKERNAKQRMKNLRKRYFHQKTFETINYEPKTVIVGERSKDFISRNILEEDKQKHHVNKREADKLVKDSVPAISGSKPMLPDSLSSIGLPDPQTDAFEGNTNNGHSSKNVLQKQINTSDGKSSKNADVLLDSHQGAPPVLPNLPPDTSKTTNTSNFDLHPDAQPLIPDSPLENNNINNSLTDSDVPVIPKENFNSQGTGNTTFQKPPVIPSNTQDLESTTEVNADGKKTPTRTLTNAENNNNNILPSPIPTTRTKGSTKSKTASPKAPSLHTTAVQHTTLDNMLSIQKPTENEINSNVEELQERTSETECKDGQCSVSNVLGSRYSDATWAMGSMTFILLLLTVSVLYTGLWKKRNQFIYGFKSREDAAASQLYKKTTVNDMLRRINSTKKKEMIRLKRMFGGKYNRVPLAEGSDVEEDSSV